MISYENLPFLCFLETLPFLKCIYLCNEHQKLNPIYFHCIREKADSSMANAKQSTWSTTGKRKHVHMYFSIWGTGTIHPIKYINEALCQHTDKR